MTGCVVYGSLTSCEEGLLERSASESDWSRESQRRTTERGFRVARAAGRRRNGPQLAA
jgi:hypothetical protein